MADLGFHQIHLADAALVLLKCRNLFQSGDQTSTGRSLRVQPALSVAYPKSLTPSVVSCVSFPVATSRTHRLKSRINAERFLSGDHRVAGAAASSRALPCRGRMPQDCTYPRSDHISSAFFGPRKNRLSVWGKLKFGEGQTVRVELHAGYRPESRRKFRVIKSRSLGSVRAFLHHELSSFRSSDGIPEASVALPDGPYAGPEYQRVRVVTHPFFSARIIGGSHRALRTARF